MGILDRLSTLVRSNLNAALDAATDPGAQIDQMVIDLENELRAARGQVAAVMAEEKKVRKRVEALGRSIDEWTARAEQAVRAGDDGLAKEALGRRGEIDAERAEAEREAAELGARVDEMTAALRAADAKVEQVKSRKETLKAQARAQKSKAEGSRPSDRLDQFVAGLDAADEMDKLDEELKAARHEDAASLEMERKFAALEKNDEIEDRLAALKAKLDKK